MKQDTFDLEQLFFEKRISLKKIQEIIEAAIIVGWENDYGPGYNLEVRVSNNDVKINRLLRVVEEVQDPKNEISHLKTSTKVNEILKENVSLMSFSRRSVYLIGEEIERLLNKATREEQYEEYKLHEGELMNCKVARTIGRSIEVRCGDNHIGILEYEPSPAERFTHGEQIACLLRKVERKDDGYQLFFDRKSMDFFKALMSQFIPDINDNLIKIRKFARNIGSKVKFLVSGEAGTNPIAACIGFKGARKKDLQSHLNKENIDFILWDDNPYSLIANCFKPQGINPEQIFIDGQNIFVVINDSFFSKAIGTRGEDVQLIQKVLSTKGRNYRILIIKSTDFAQKQDEFRRNKAKEIAEFGGSEEKIYEFLVSSGFSEQHVNFLDNSIEMFETPDLRTEEEKQEEENRRTVIKLDNEITNILNYVALADSETKKACEKYCKSKLDQKEEFLKEYGIDDKLYDKIRSFSASSIFKLIDSGIRTIAELKTIKNIEELNSRTGLEKELCLLLLEE